MFILYTKRHHLYHLTFNRGRVNKLIWPEKLHYQNKIASEDKLKFQKPNFQKIKLEVHKYILA